jgi:hypothetical protein
LVNNSREYWREETDDRLYESYNEDELNNEEEPYVAQPKSRRSNRQKFVPYQGEYLHCEMSGDPITYVYAA